MNRFPFLVLLPVCLMTMGGYCESDVIDDAGFQFWCGDELCAWEREGGAVRKVPTWHEHDYAVELVGAPVVLSQQASRAYAGCVRLELIADVEESAMLSLEVDNGGDGSADWQVQVAGEGFRSMAWELRGRFAPGGDSIFTLRKLGEGRAVIAQLRASSECEDGWP